MDRFYKHLLTLDPLGQLAQPMPMVITMHLITEYWLNRLIQERTRIEKENCVRELGMYAAKLKLVTEKELLPNGLCKNLTSLNRMRNGYAHDLDYDFSHHKGIAFANHFGDPITLEPKDTMKTLSAVRCPRNL